MNSSIDQETVKYINQYYPTVEINDNYVFQETLRRLTAEDTDASNEDFTTGWCTKKHLDENLKDAKISEDFRNFIQEKMKSIPEYPNNIRGPIKAILTYPQKGFLPWNVFSGLEDVIETANSIIRDQPAKLEIVEGKVYATLGKFNDVLYERANLKERKLLGFDMEPNKEYTGHVTVINSDVLCRVDLNKVQDILSQVNSFPIDITFTDCKHTCSFDWPRFSVCCVIALKSVAIQNFIDRFNAEFGTKIAPSTHITFLVRNRDRRNL